MNLPNVFTNCVSRPPVRPKLAVEADRLVAIWGAQAPEIERSRQFRASAGLLHEDPPGFWARVARQVCHHLGVPEEARWAGHHLDV